jgi:hypothetical protein
MDAFFNVIMLYKMMQYNGRDRCVRYLSLVFFNLFFLGGQTMNREVKVVALFITIYEN